MKRICFLTIITALLSYPLLGQQATSRVAESSVLTPTRAEVEKFMEIMQVRKRLESTVRTQQDEMRTVTHNMFNKVLPDATPDQRAKFEDIVATSFKEMLAKYPFDDVLRDMIPIYQAHFTESDLKEIAVFYSSPIGQKVLNEMPATTAEAARVSLARLKPKMDEMMENLYQRLDEMANNTNSDSARH